MDAACAQATGSVSPVASIGAAGQAVGSRNTATDLGDRRADQPA